MNLHIPDVKILEVHPTPWNRLQDNCQPSSLLKEPKGLGLAPLLRGVADAAKLGYNFLHIAGVEPLRYAGLPALCREAHRHGMLTSAVTGGTALTASQLAWLRFSIDLLGVELEDRGARRKRRASLPGVGATIEQRLAMVRAAEIPFAIVFCLTSASLADLGWAAEFAAAQGAAMLHLQPSAELAGESMGAAWRKVESLWERYRGKLVIHFEAVNRYNLPAQPGDMVSWVRNLGREARHLGEIVSPLVIEHDGAVAPLSYGFPRRFAFGSLRKERLATMATRWIESQAGAFSEVYGAVLLQARAADRTFGDWYVMLSLEAQRPEVGIPAAC